MAGPLNGLRVLEVTTTVAGAYCGRLLAGMGADVLKVEPPEGDPLRRYGPFPGDVPHPEKSGLFLHLNQAKRGVTLEVGSPSGRDLLGRLLERTDALVHDLPPQRAEELGLTPEELPRRHPRLVAAVVTYFGSRGPYARYQGTELVAEALSGYMSITGEPDREPLKPHGFLAEYQAGLQAAVAVMAGLLAREARGAGDVADVSVAEAATFLMGGPPVLAYLFGQVWKRNGTRLIGMGDRHPYPSTLRPCRDGWVHAHSNNRHPDLLAALVGDPWLASPQVLEAMTAHADEIDARLDAWLADKSKWEAVELAQELRLPFTEVLDPLEVLEDRHGHHLTRGTFVEVEHPVAGRVRQLGAPVKLSATPWQVGRAPLLGEHNEQVFCGELGLPREELVRLRQAGIV